jgi:hypothetical protein
MFLTVGTTITAKHVVSPMAVKLAAVSAAASPVFDTLMITVKLFPESTAAGFDMLLIFKRASAQITFTAAKKNAADNIRLIYLIFHRPLYYKSRY